METRFSAALGRCATAAEASTSQPLPELLTELAALEAAARSWQAVETPYEAVVYARLDGRPACPFEFFESAFERLDDAALALSTATEAAAAGDGFALGRPGAADAWGLRCVSVSSQ